jgi:methyl-accepting chemotaxis protein
MTREVLMNNEETERTMQFILEQQAQITIKVDRIAERVDRIAEKVDRIAEKVDRLADAQLKYEARTGRLEESFLILVQLAQSTDERLDEVGRKMSDVSDKMGDVSDKMNEVSVKMGEVSDKMGEVGVKMGEVGVKMGEVSVKMGEVSVKMSEFSVKMNVLTDAQIRTDENIKNLTAVVDRYFSEGRSGIS